MKILHTSDWHLGVSLRDHPRDVEHAAFLAWLTDTIVAREVDAVLIAGDIFDTANPPSRALALWYGWLAAVLERRPGLQIVAIGGNHDSAARLDAPAALLQRLRIHTTGGLERTAEGVMEVGPCVVPIRDASGAVAAVVGAVPFLGALSAEEIAGVYARTCEALRQSAPPTAALLLMGHLFAVGGRAARRSTDSERMMAGGVEHVSVGVFPDDVAYVALGHLHLGQLPSERVAYCGSPLPLSFGERDYEHRVLLVDVVAAHSGRATVAIESVPIPRSVPVESWPHRGEPTALLSAADALLRVQMRPR
jgi:DNA repair protein SbcD/Mre11